MFKSVVGSHFCERSNIGRCGSIKASSSGLFTTVMAIVDGVSSIIVSVTGVEEFSTNGEKVCLECERGTFLAGERFSS